MTLQMFSNTRGVSPLNDLKFVFLLDSNQTTNQGVQQKILYITKTRQNKQRLL